MCLLANRLVRPRNAPYVRDVFAQGRARLIEAIRIQVRDDDFKTGKVVDQIAGDHGVIRADQQES